MSWVVDAVNCVERVASVTPTDPGRIRPLNGSNSGTLPKTTTQPATPDKAPSPSCDTMNIDDIMTQAYSQFSAGFAPSAVSLVIKALRCRQDVRMYRLVVMYACVAHNAAVAKLYFPKVPAQYQRFLVERCQQEGIALP